MAVFRLPNIRSQYTLHDNAVCDLDHMFESLSSALGAGRLDDCGPATTTCATLSRQGSVALQGASRLSPADAAAHAAVPLARHIRSL
jgi:hypothetical protein